MQDELDAMDLPRPVHIHNVNAVGYDSGLPDLIAVTDLPILQDDSTANVWTNWSAVWRDVFVLGPHNEVTAVYNLTEYGLSDPTNYDLVKQAFIDAAYAAD